ncbi:MAG: hypothetical protein ACOZCO_07385 [Bacteroidota bacterium]
MKTKLLLPLLFSCITLFAHAQSNLQPEKLDRAHWRKLKKGLRYDSSPGKKDYNQRWQDEFENPEKENPENSGEKSSSRKGFGKYTDHYIERDGKYEDGINQREREPINMEDRSSPDVSVPSGLGGLFQVLLIGGLIAAVIFILYKILTGASLKGRKKVGPVEEDEQPEQVELPKSELELLLEKALKENNFREAVRIYFIFIIKSLKEKNWITWEKKKTNQYYLLEMRDRMQYQTFSKSIMIFEVVWYGKRELTPSEYAQVEPFFKELLKSIERTA